MTSSPISTSDLRRTLIEEYLAQDCHMRAMPMRVQSVQLRDFFRMVETTHKLDTYREAPRS